MGGKKPDYSKHNATCFNCGGTYKWDYFTKKGIDERGVINEGHKCSMCRKANKDSGNDRMDRYTWASIREIDATWGAVKRGELWEEALKSFAQSLPVSEDKQQLLFEALK